MRSCFSRLIFKKFLRKSRLFKACPRSVIPTKVEESFSLAGKPIPVRPAEKGRCHPTNPWLPSNRFPPFP